MRYLSIVTLCVLFTTIFVVGCTPIPPPEGIKMNVVYSDVDGSAKDSEASLPPVISIVSPNVKRSLKIVEKGSTISVSGIAQSNSGIAKVTINGQEAALDEKGNFIADVLLKVGENKISVIAIGVNRKQKAEMFTVVREAGSHTPINAISINEGPIFTGKGKYYALVIGINSYKQIAPLKTATNDAKTIEKILKNDYQFETKAILDQAATRETILNELVNYRKKLTQEDSFLIYYAGHGVHDSETDASYWLPVDAMIDNSTNWVDAKSVTDELKRISARHVLLISDSCYSGTMTRSVDPLLTGSDTRDNYLRKIRNKSARVLISSGGNEPVSDSGGKGHSIFADVIIKALQKPDKRIFTAEELFVANIKESVAGNASQTPEYKIIRNSGHDGGDFVFVRKE